jgi:hypothetical protein
VAMVGEDTGFTSSLGIALRLSLALAG